MTEAELDSGCQHHWMIDRPNGPTSRGTCTLCGRTSEFMNSIQGSGWDRESPQAKRARQARRQQQLQQQRARRQI